MYTPICGTLLQKCLWFYMSEHTFTRPQKQRYSGAIILVYKLYSVGRGAKNDLLFCRQIAPRLNISGEVMGAFRDMREYANSPGGRVTACLAQQFHWHRHSNVFTQVSPLSVCFYDRCSLRALTVHLEWAWVPRKPLGRLARSLRFPKNAVSFSEMGRTLFWDPNL